MKFDRLTIGSGGMDGMKRTKFHAGAYMISDAAIVRLDRSHAESLPSPLLVREGPWDASHDPRCQGHVARHARAAWHIVSEGIWFSLFCQVDRVSHPPHNHMANGLGNTL